MFKCEICNKEFKTKQSYGGHTSSHNRGESYRKKRETTKSIQKRLNIEQNKCCKFCGKRYNNGQQTAGHQNHCELNPNADAIRLKMIESNKNRNHTAETKQKLSEIMKQRHKDGLAWNIGKSRWNNKQSYPEKYFSKVIVNEFDDVVCETEYPLGNFSFDFAWVHKKKAIEIDGEQHYRFKEYIDRDIRKDKLAKQNGWDVLRIRWKDMYNNPKQFIKIANEFIGN
jgi:very-short-patch-repair endonuclease